MLDITTTNARDTFLVIKLLHMEKVKYDLFTKEDDREKVVVHFLCDIDDDVRKREIEHKYHNQVY